MKNEVLSLEKRLSYAKKRQETQSFKSYIKPQQPVKQIIEYSVAAAQTKVETCRISAAM